MASASRPPIDVSQTFDVLIIGGGNAALCAAMSAAHANANAKILVLESAPEAFRAGNSRLGRSASLVAQAWRAPVLGNHYRHRSYRHWQ